MIVQIIFVQLIASCSAYVELYGTRIEKDKLSMVKVGAELKVFCFIDWPKQSGNGTLRWSWKRHSTGNDPIILAQEENDIPNINRTKIGRSLYFLKFMDTHKGLYWCNFTSEAFTSSTSAHISTKSNLSMVVTDSTRVYAERGTDPEWYISTNFDVNGTIPLWKRGYAGDVFIKGILAVNMLEYSKYKLSLLSSRYVRVEIENADFEDTNWHFISFQLPDSTDNLRVVLEYQIGISLPEIIFEKPRTYEVINVVLDKDTYGVGEIITAKCSVKFPRRQSKHRQWFFKETGPAVLSDNPKAKYRKILGATYRRYTEDNQYYEEIQWPATASGLLACAVDDNGTLWGSSVRYVCVSHVRAYLQMDGPSMLHEGDNLSVLCQVPQCNLFGNETLKLFYKPSKDMSFEMVSASNRTELELQINNATVNASGIYMCQYESVGFAFRDTLFVSVISYQDYNLPQNQYYYFFILILFFVVLISFLIYRHQRKRTEFDLFVKFFQNDYVLSDLKREDLQIAPDHKSMDQGVKLQSIDSLPVATVRTNSIDQVVKLQSVDLLPVDSRWWFPREKLKLTRKIGAGFFGEVFQADAIGIRPDEEQTTVAVKMVKHGADAEVTKSLIKEFKIMSHIGGHEFIIRLLAAVVTRRDFALIVEFCHYGCILSYLVKHRHRFNKHNRDFYENSSVVGFDQSQLYVDSVGVSEMPLNIQVLLGWSYQISRGMEWLAERKVLHGDLAARNILLTKNNIIKISDFGLASDLYANFEYQKSANLKLPIKWMALESIKDRIFSTQSDVWSFGVTLWEIFSLGATPYPEYADLRDVWQELQRGYRMEKPDYAPGEVYDMMLKCWQVTPMDRPTFTETSTFLSDLLEGSLKNVYLQLEVVNNEEASSAYKWLMQDE